MEGVADVLRPVTSNATPSVVFHLVRKNAWQQLVRSTAILEMEAAPDKHGSLTLQM